MIKILNYGILSQNYEMSQNYDVLSPIYEIKYRIMTYKVKIMTKSNNYDILSHYEIKFM